MQRPVADLRLVMQARGEILKERRAIGGRERLGRGTARR
jgi:hypothetical protein